jgi:hypothetical protein
MQEETKEEWSYQRMNRHAGPHAEPIWASPGAAELTTEANCMMLVRSPVRAETLY